MIIRGIVFFIVLASTKLWSQDLSPVKKGKIDLSNWNYVGQPSLLLNGEWAFYWNKLILSKDMKPGIGSSFAELSTPWSEQIIDGKQYPKDGCASYSLEIILPKNLHTISFAVPAVFNSYAFWVNDTLRCTSGKVSTKPGEMEPSWKPQAVMLDVTTDTVDIVFQIANFQHTRGGCAEHIRIGTGSYLSNLNSTFHTSGIILIIFFGITGIFCLAVAFLNRRTSFLFLSLLALAYTLRFLFSDLYFYYDIGLNPGWEIAAKIEYITIPLIVLCASLFLAAIYPQDFKKTILTTLVAISLLLIVVVIIAPFSVLSPVLILLQVVGLAFVLVIVYVIVRALITKKAGAWITGLGVLVFAMVGFYNIYAFATSGDLNRIIIHSGYAAALLLNIFSLLYRTPLRLKSEEEEVLRYADLYNSDGSFK